MENSSSRILTTHVDSLVRPPEIRGLMRGKEFGQEYDREELARGVRSGVGEVVQRQLAESIGIPSDGEYGKSEFSAYMTECLRVLNPVPRTRTRAFYSIGAGDRSIFRKFYLEYDQTAESASGGPVVCTGPITYQGQAAAQT